MKRARPRTWSIRSGCAFGSGRSPPGGGPGPRHPPGGGSVQVEILPPRGRAMRLTEENFEQTLQKVREVFDTARRQQGLSQREPSFRLAVLVAPGDQMAREHAASPV